MNIITNTIRRAPVPNYHEGSSLRSPRDADTVQQEWKRNRELSRQLEGYRENISLLQRQLNMLRRQLGAQSGDEIEVTICDPSTGEERIIMVVGRDVTAEGGGGA